GFFLFTVILLPFSASFMAEYLNTPYASPGIVVYCANSWLHNVGWNLLNTSVMRPTPLVRNPTSLAHAQTAAKGSKRGFLLYSSLLLLALWSPYVAMVITV